METTIPKFPDDGHIWCVTDFKDKQHADYGAASTHGGHYCMDCKWRRGEKCFHYAVSGPFSLGTHPDRMGCRNCWEQSKRKAAK